MLNHNSDSMLIREKEEDFVTNLYHRNLLTDFTVADIIVIVHQANHWLDTTNSIEEVYSHAIRKRLNFREAMLLAVNLDNGNDENTRIDAWRACLQILPTIQQTWVLGSRVDAAFSAKIQRRLASSVPPRPVVKISFEDAHSLLGRICANGLEALGLLRCDNATSAMVYISRDFSSLGSCLTNQ